MRVRIERDDPIVRRRIESLQSRPERFVGEQVFYLREVLPKLETRRHPFPVSEGMVREEPIDIRDLGTLQADQYSKQGWSARLTQDGKTEAAPILRAYLGARAVKIPAGDSLVDFEYEIPWIRLCLWISLLATLLIAAAALAPYTRRFLRSR